MITDRMLKMFRRKEKPCIVTRSADPGRVPRRGRRSSSSACAGLTAPDKARRGMQLAAVGMLVGRGRHAGRITRSSTTTWILIGVVVGSAIGAAMAIWMPMTAMPQRTAISHAFGALAATLVGISPVRPSCTAGERARPRATWRALGFEVMFGSLTITGSLMAFGKLQELLPGAPITYEFQNASNIALFAVAVLLFVYLVVDPVAARTRVLSDGAGSGWRSAC